MGFDIGSSRSTTANQITTTSVDSFNRAFTNSRNDSNSNNLNIAVGTDESPFLAPGDAVQTTALYVAGALGMVALAAYWLVSRKRS